MARLNDAPAPPPESIDALKRRFIRQNREIARVNSTQSQRIRNLETEISRLVAENISLREQAIAAQAEAGRWRNANNVNREILDMKDRMERKVNELSLLIAEMGQLPEKAAEKGRRKSGMRDPRNSTDQGWLNRQSVREAIASDREPYDGRLPVIQEDKLYPRRTLETAEVMAIRDEEALQQASESPELGPPPVAHFDVAEPIAFGSSGAVDYDNSEDSMPLPAASEKRRKRRTSSLLQDMPTEPVSEPSLPAEAGPQLLKSGAKRKLDLTELEEQVPLPPGENDDFVFQRRQAIWNNPASIKKASRFTRAPGRENEKPTETDGSSPQKSTGGARKILAPKSTNSPTKRRVQVSEKFGNLKDDRDGEQKQSVNASPRKRRVQPEFEVPGIVLDANEAVEPHSLPPKTPSAQEADILSPISTEPSARPTHHSQEAAVLNSVEDVLNGSIGRGSRRARAAVSYAEPNLRDKMRRPGKELVGAVEGLAKNKDNPPSAHARGSSIDRAPSEALSGIDTKDVVIKVKQEKDTSEQRERWNELAMPVSSKKEEPTSPLRDKERKEIRRDKEHPNIEANPLKQINRRQRYSNELEKAVDQMKIFDPPTASPIEEPKSPNAARDYTKTASAATSKRKVSGSAIGRRHSTQPTSASSLNSAAGDDKRASRTSESTSNLKGQLPRPSSATSLRQHPVNDIEDKHLKRSQSVSSKLRATRAETDEPDSARSVSSSARNERITNRRQSMMV
ncbi:hypothetical protein A1O3_06345 [Capronia epimyces CBS 606.96]|uniref:Shugoshin C-terminal domain-containing protein n=1 Tax=Capronia epimyces CBS 606.96 TaxID=1182542 RepID=W9XPR6_9EURO|nr:uncharacterized protein A1O3_06345 [Capronia epimyces CBS 606.96]EXJ82532.1 hypothetical protein A1O3_06345 [Capronia epimyces CBS 606.96]